MKRVFVGAMAVLVAVIAAPAAEAQKPPKQAKGLSISAVPSPVKFGKSVAITGKLTGPQRRRRDDQTARGPVPVGRPDGGRHRGGRRPGRLFVYARSGHQHALPDRPGGSGQRGRHRLGQPPSVPAPQRPDAGRPKPGALLRQGLPASTTAAPWPSSARSRPGSGVPSGPQRSPTRPAPLAPPTRARCASIATASGGLPCARTRTTPQA